MSEGYKLDNDLGSSEARLGAKGEHGFPWWTMTCSGWRTRIESRHEEWCEPRGVTQMKPTLNFVVLGDWKL